MKSLSVDSVLSRFLGFNFRLASASLIPSANVATKSQEEKFGLPPRPRKPLTPYFRFLADVRPKVVKENPKLSVLEVVKVRNNFLESHERISINNNFRSVQSSGRLLMKP